MSLSNDVADPPWDSRIDSLHEVVNHSYGFKQTVAHIPELTMFHHEMVIIL